MSVRRTSDDLDDAVVAAACRGDERALTLVWRSLQPALLRYLRSLGNHDAEDVASAVWLEVAKALPALDPAEVGPLRRLLFTIARRRMIDEFRRRQRRPAVEMETDLEDEDASAEGELATALSYLHQLPPAQAEVIALRVIAGFPSEEVGRITGQKAGAVRVMAHRGLATLRKLLEAEMGRSAQQGENEVTNPVSRSIDQV